LDETNRERSGKFAARMQRWKTKNEPARIERFVLFEILSSGSFAASQGRVKGTSGI